ncbi:cell wall-active antibiotics response protein [Anaerobacillus arseniciselenatis]|uniref:Cell wall-active antibiotics response protein n=1 Tax=Anaerobacillus arseniciselenatis TaxID=85682 RepID=A0A1S2LND5_9BACI|nr:cell wall-active antibiotics response protein LiaF [Anaerobacillus arseniciselenatis]OIJ14032.1 cell wall-active antibiotics response protein [Anaerobacillus arseniciselenatis]
MDNHNKTDYISWTVLIGLLLLLVEITFFSKGLVFAILFSGIFIYFGAKRFYGSSGKLFFFIGCFILFFTIISMMVFKFLIFAAIIYVIFYFYKSKTGPIVIEPNVKEGMPTNDATKKIRSQQLLKNLFYGRQKTSEEVFEWDDINIQTGIGDTRIDLSNTVLPKGEAVISIRNFIGNIQILVPYDIEVNVSHSVVTGTTIIFEAENEKLFNQTLSYRTEKYDEAQQKIKIVTSMGIGRLEVKRI